MATRTERGEETRARVLAAARKLARVHGFGGTTLAMIQKEAGVHPGSLYWLFGDRDGIYAELVSGVYLETTKRQIDVATAGNPVRAALEMLADNPARFELWRFNIALMLDHQAEMPKTAEQIRLLRRHTQDMMTRQWIEQLPDAVLEHDPSLARRLAEQSLVTVEGCILARIAGRPVDEELVTSQASSILDAMVAAACHGAGVPVPPLIAERFALERLALDLDA